MKEKFYFTTAIAYTSKIPHIGNTYEAVLADAIVRYKRNRGYDVYFLTGTDEHGEKIEAEAKRLGRDPQEHVDIIAGEIQAIWDLMKVSYDQFIRTSDPKHKRIVQRIFEKLYKQGDIYKGFYEGLYCVRCESFYTESQLHEGKCPECEDVVTETKEEAYFFKLSKYQKQLEEYIEKTPDFIYPASRKHEMLNNFIKPGLKDLCVSRSSFSWGVPLTIDEGHVIYVWMDALSNYITALGYDPDGDSDELFLKNWPADLHLVGKDIVRFHTIYWPIFLIAMGLELPKQVYGHPWVLAEGGKMSKSLGNTLYARDLVDRFGLDRVRYVLLRDIPFADDGVLTPDSIISRSNSDLANITGNLLQRTLSMSHKYFDGVVAKGSEFEEVDLALIEEVKKTIERYEAKMDNYHLAEGLEAVISLAKKSNKYIDDTMPWLLAKDPEKQDRLKTVLYVLTENLRIISILLQPAIPDSVADLQAQLQSKVLDYDTIYNYGQLEENLVVGKPHVLFERLEELPDEEEKSVEEVFKDEIEFGDWEKIDLRVAEIIDVSYHPKADRLYILQLNVGESKRQVVSGIRDYYEKQELIGKHVLYLANLKPIKLRGVESQGMLLAESQGEKVLLLEAQLDSGAEIS